MYTIVETPTFARQWRDYWTEDERGEFVAWLALHPVMYAKGVKDSIPAKTLNMIRETVDG